jgi:phage tail-like protein
LAADAQGNIYVVDVLNRDESRVLKFDLRGRLRTAFWETARQTDAFQRPVGVAVGTFRGQAHVFVLDASLKAVVVLTVDGGYVTRFGQGQLIQPLAIATIDGTVYVGDNGIRQVLVFKPTTSRPQEICYAGASFGYTGPVAALAGGARGELWLHPGGSGTPLLLDAAGAYARSGVLWGGPFGTGLRSVQWHRLKATLAGLGEGAHAQFFVYGSDDPTRLPDPPDSGSNAPFHGADWRPLPLDVADGLIPPPQSANRVQAPNTSALPPDRALLARELNALAKETYLWVGAHLTGEGLSSPVLGQLWLNYDHATYRQYLPAIFSRDREQAELLDRLLSLLESFFDEAEGHIHGLDRLFDPRAAPAGWLAWLAGWVGLELDESWPEDFQRDAIQQALENYTRRGTAQGLREALRASVGIDARIEEPLLGSDWWALVPPGAGDTAGPSVSLLGFTTRLAPAQAEGAVLGGSATLDRSSLIDAEDYGAPLFEALAHQFIVQVYRGQVRGDGDLERIQAVVEREKPTHTVHHLCVIEPRMRVGFQARLGIDTLVAGPLPPAPLAGTSTGEGLVLGGDTPGRIGSDSRVGRTTRLATGGLK